MQKNIATQNLQMSGNSAADAWVATFEQHSRVAELFLRAARLDTQGPPVR